jgi:hypothetical protein
MANKTAFFYGGFYWQGYRNGNTVRILRDGTEFFSANIRPDGAWEVSIPFHNTTDDAEALMVFQDRLAG